MFNDFVNEEELKFFIYVFFFCFILIKFIVFSVFSVLWIVDLLIWNCLVNWCIGSSLLLGFNVLFLIIVKIVLDIFL